LHTFCANSPAAKPDDGFAKLESLTDLRTLTLQGTHVTPFVTDVIDVATMSLCVIAEEGGVQWSDAEFATLQHWSRTLRGGNGFDSNDPKEATGSDEINGEG
jgi:hypothetical protein